MLDYNALTLFLYVFLRMTGFLFASPIFGRTNVPRYFIGALAFVFSLTVYSAYDRTVRVPDSLAELFVRMLLELFLGVLPGFVTRFFFFIPDLAGEVADTQMGMAMARTYDPGTAASSTMTASILGQMMLLLFFTADGHITLLRILLTSGNVVPFGSAALGVKAADHALLLFAECALLALKLVLPILGAELLGQMGMGVLMKAIPQINVFALNIELKIIVGLVLLSALMPAIGQFLIEAESTMLRELEILLSIAAGG